MASKITIGVGLDSRNVKKGVASVKQQLNTLKSAAKSVGGVILGGLAVGGLRQIVNDFDRIGKLAKRFDVTTSTMQRLQYASQLAGADVEAVAKAMTRATVAGQDAADGLTTMQRAFGDLNIDVEEFNKLSPEQQLQAVGRAYNDAGQSQEAYAAVLKILGTRAQELIPMLKEMSETMDKAPIVSDEAIKGAEAFNDALTHMKTELMAIIGLPLGKVSEALKGWKAGFETFGEEGGKNFWSRLLAGLTGGRLGGGGEDYDAKADARVEELMKNRERKIIAEAAQPSGTEGSIPATRATNRSTGALLTENPFALPPEAYGALHAGGEVELHKLMEGQKHGQNSSPVVASSLAAIGGGGGVASSLSRVSKDHLAVAKDTKKLLEQRLPRQTDAATLRP